MNSRTLNTRASRIAPLFLFFLTAVTGTEASTTLRYDLDQAVAVAFAKSPTARRLQAELVEARGRLTEASTYPLNPTLGFELARRRGPDSTSADYGVSVSQEIEIGGQRGKRMGVAEAELAAITAKLQREQRLLAARVALAFSEAVRLGALREIEAADATLAGEYADFTERKFAAGATSLIERNFAEAAAGRAERRRSLAGASYREAQALLAQAMGLTASVEVDPVDAGTADQPPLPPLDDLLRMALENRADLVEFQYRVVAAGKQRDLARAEARPNLSLSGFVDREAGTETIAGVGLAIGLPIFQRQQGRLAETRAGILRAEAERDELSLGIEQEIVSAHARYTASIESLAQLQQRVMSSLQENLDLLGQAFTAGKIGSLELLVFGREFVQSRLDHAEAVAEARRARITLDLASGRTPVPVAATAEE